MIEVEAEVKSASGIKAYFENFSYATELREMEADTVIYHCKDAERVVIMGDLNEVSGASSMRKFEDAGYKDAWSVGGFGYGATIHHPLPYRIDHVLYNSGLKLKGIKKINAKGISDHDALVAVFDLEQGKSLSSKSSCRFNRHINQYQRCHVHRRLDVVNNQ